MIEAQDARNLHDEVLEFVLEALRAQLPDLAVVRADTRENQSRFRKLGRSPVLIGYRPDAYCVTNGMIVMVEIKSTGDFNSEHSVSQYEAAYKIIESVDNWSILLVVFGRRTPMILKSSIMHALITHPRFELKVLSDGTDHT